MASLSLDDLKTLPVADLLAAMRKDAALFDREFVSSLSPSHVAAVLSVLADRFEAALHAETGETAADDLTGDPRSGPSFHLAEVLPIADAAVKSRERDDAGGHLVTAFRAMHQAETLLPTPALAALVAAAVALDISLDRILTAATMAEAQP